MNTQNLVKTLVLKGVAAGMLIGLQVRCEPMEREPMYALKNCVPLFFLLCLVPVSASYAAGDEYGAAAVRSGP